MKVTLLPVTWIGKTLVRLGITKPLEITFDFSQEGKFVVKTNKQAILPNIMITFDRSFDSKTVFRNINQ